MDVIGVQNMFKLECCTIPDMDCSVVCTSSKYDLTAAHFLPVDRCHSSSVASKCVNGFSCKERIYEDLSNTPHFLWVYRGKTPSRMFGRTREKLVNHEP